MKHPDPDSGVSRETTLSEAWIEGARTLTGSPIDPLAVARLERYATFLGTEGVAAGGLGPLEAGRLLDRHLADSLAFGSFLPSVPFDAVDVGSGLGLPGIPLAVVYPESSWILLDRSGRRCRLMRRAVRILELEGVDVIESDVDHIARSFDVVTFRASLQLPDAADAFRRLSKPDGVGIFALSRRPDRPRVDADAFPAVDMDLEAVEHAILDSPAWFLRMRAT